MCYERTDPLLSSVSPGIPITTAVAASAPTPGPSLLGARRLNPSSSLLVHAVAVATTPAPWSSLLGTWGLTPLNAAPSIRAADPTTAAPQLALYTRHEHNGNKNNWSLTPDRSTIKMGDSNLHRFPAIDIDSASKLLSMSWMEKVQCPDHMCQR